VNDPDLGSESVPRLASPFRWSGAHAYATVQVALHLGFCQSGLRADGLRIPATQGQALNGRPLCFERQKSHVKLRW
jgi:hypothetical protein